MRKICGTEVKAPTHVSHTPSEIHTVHASNEMLMTRIWMILFLLLRLEEKEEEEEINGLTIA